MNTRINAGTGMFYRVLATVTTTVPLLLVIAAGICPDGERGALIVVGFGALLAIIAIALLLRAVYSWGFDSASSRPAEYAKDSCFG